MKNLPKSKLGAFAAISYLLAVFAVLALLIPGYGNRGPHGVSAAIIWAIVLTLPISGYLFVLLEPLKMPNPTVDQFVTFGVFVLSAIINAVIIYFAIWLVSRVFRTIINGLRKNIGKTDLKQIMLIPAALTLFGTAGLAESKTIASVYTNLSPKACRQMEPDRADGILYRGECPGIGGFKLEVTEGDARQDLSIILPGGEIRELRFFEHVSSAFSGLGGKAEWRVRRSGSKIVPAALLVRFDAYENPDFPERVTSYLVVVRLNPDAPCITDVLKPSKNQNLIGRELADRAAERACRMNFYEIDDFLKFATREKEPLWDQAEGDLDGDGLKDWAGVVRGRKNESFGNGETAELESAQLFILIGKRTGGYHIAGNSQEVPFSQGNVLFEGVEIKNSSVYLQINSKTAGSIEARFYQFKLYRDLWRLVGYRTFYLEIEADSSIETDRNLLTGAILVTREKGNRKTVVKRRSQRFPAYKLKDFDFEVVDLLNGNTVL
jgi:hypothetical protein